MIRPILVLAVTTIVLNYAVSVARAEPSGEPPPPSTEQNLGGQVADLNIEAQPPTAAAAVPKPSAKQIIASTEGDFPDVTVDIHELKRTSGDTLTLKFTLNNASSEDVDFSYNFTEGGDFATISGTHLLDAANKKKYFVVKDSDGKCACSSGLKSIKPGSKGNLWAKFPAPPASVNKITVEIPHFIPAEDVPIS